MKKIILTLSIALLSTGMSFAQLNRNTFPAAGNVGLGTSLPTEALDIKTGSIRLQSMAVTNVVSSQQNIEAGTRYVYVDAAGKLIAGDDVLGKPCLTCPPVGETGPAALSPFWSMDGNLTTGRAGRLNILGTRDNADMEIDVGGIPMLKFYNDHPSKGRSIQVGGSSTAVITLFGAGDLDFRDAKFSSTNTNTLTVLNSTNTNTLTVLNSTNTNTLTVGTLNGSLSFNNGEIKGNASTNTLKSFRIFGNTSAIDGPFLELTDKDNSTNSGDLILGAYSKQAGKGNLIFQTRSNNTSLERMRITDDGRVCIGTTNPGTNKLAVEGVIAARELKLVTGNFPDYVFADDYQLMSISELKNYIESNDHLPGLPKASEIQEDGGQYEVGQLSLKLLEKMEEMTLYTIQLQEKVAKLEKELEAIKK